MFPLLKNCIVALALISSTSVAQAESPAKIKLLIVEGASNHDWKHRLAVARDILDRDGSFAVDVTVTPQTDDEAAWNAWRPDFSKYDVVLSGYNSLGGKHLWPEPVQRSFEEFVRNGGGFYCFHEANNSFSQWPEYNRMIGLGWRGKDYGTAIIVNPDESLQKVPQGEGAGTNHHSRGDVTVHQLGEHPIHRGLPRAWMAANLEVYRYARGPAENLTVISYAKDPQTGVQFPTEWVVQYGKGRVFASTYGHCWGDEQEPKGLGCSAFQTILIRGLKWVAGRDPGDTIPPDFPKPDQISLRPLIPWPGASTSAPAKKN
jgi:type 1 glutamine amidotransferase